MHLIITRHGETVENVKRIFQGQTHGVLTKKGIMQAKKLARRLKNRKIDKIYSSDLKRSIDTANEILKYHPKLKLILNKDLRERFVGNYAGKPFPKGWDWNNLPKSCETDKSMCIRAKKFLKKINSKNRKDKIVLVVCHNGIIKAFLNVIYGHPVSYFNQIEDNHNTSVYEFEIVNGKYIPISSNCVKHLIQ